MHNAMLLPVMFCASFILRDSFGELCSVQEFQIATLRSIGSNAFRTARNYTTLHIIHHNLIS